MARVYKFLFGKSIQCLRPASVSQGLGTRGVLRHQEPRAWSLIGHWGSIAYRGRHIFHKMVLRNTRTSLSPVKYVPIYLFMAGGEFWVLRHHAPSGAAALKRGLGRGLLMQAPSVCASLAAVNFPSSASLQQLQSFCCPAQVR